MSSTPDPNRNRADHSAVPPYLRPTSTRHHSSSSIQSNSSARSHPRPQNEYIPTSTGIAAVAGAGEGIIETDMETRRVLDDDEQSEVDEDADWDNIREGSIMGRPDWRKPRPSWIYPFLIGTVLSIGMGIAPQSELVINLVCLAHPPQQHSSTNSQAFVDFDTRDMSSQFAQWKDYADGDSSINATLPITPPSLPDQPLSAADRWFLKLQKEIYDYKYSHRDAPSAPRTTILPSAPGASRTLPAPSGSLPRPTDTPSDQTPPYPSPGPTEGRSPFEAVNPKLCKRDPGVQAAAARLVMSTSSQRRP